MMSTNDNYHIELVNFDLIRPNRLRRYVLTPPPSGMYIVLEKGDGPDRRMIRKAASSLAEKAPLNDHLKSAFGPDVQFEQQREMVIDGIELFKVIATIQDFPGEHVTSYRAKSGAHTLEMSVKQFHARKLIPHPDYPGTAAMSDAEASYSDKWQRLADKLTAQIAKQHNITLTQPPSPAPGQS